MTDQFEFDLTPLRLKDLPTSANQLIVSANAVIEDITAKWSKGKLYNGHTPNKVQMYNTKLYGEPWMARVSYHDASVTPFEWFARGLIGAEQSTTAIGNQPEGEWVIEDKYAHTRNEMEYIAPLANWTPVEISTLSGYDKAQTTHGKEFLDQWQCVRVHYDFPGPLAVREFSEYLYIQKPMADPNTGDLTMFVISLVADLPVSEPGMVHGVYTSIERVRWIKKDNMVEWKMATVSDAKGNVPRWIQNATIANSVAGDVSSYFNWLDDKKW
ncbi:hypothetical protein NADFUDRAFT_46370 [Nadsonia fulvescens var. elongata DSM 6958]|uniref:DUF3074 domain-containing protein n=1 Tax=Nadsonia fulvescens var. elongata DSM 6958 TaxID=857566 RepID=A0A1E3PJX6_9ASCO|nr:hypothetical protein NADFUDRAFT_46370 [Nadsonia fulvescens var. elongata DSM 6958]